MLFLSKTIRLNKQFDVLSLQSCFQRVSHLKKIPAGYPGEGNVAWDSLSIYSFASDDHDLLSELPYLQQELGKLNLQIRLARFLTLEPGGVIKEHTDNFLSDSIVRLHIPVITHEDVEFRLDNEECKWEAGEFWYGNFGLPHRGQNNSPITRVHLVLDVTTDHNLLKLFPPSVLDERFFEENPTIDNSVLEKFTCRFKLPAGFQLPGVELAQLDSALEGEISAINGELCLFVNEQPMLRLEAVTEDKVAVLGLGSDAYIDFQFRKNEIKTLTLSISGLSIPIIS